MGENDREWREAKRNFKQGEVGRGKRLGNASIFLTAHSRAWGNGALKRKQRLHLSPDLDWGFEYNQEQRSSPPRHR